jgi:hypothetical protein
MRTKDPETFIYLCEECGHITYTVGRQLSDFPHCFVVRQVDNRFRTCRGRVWLVNGEPQPEYRPDHQSVHGARHQLVR